MSEYNGRRAPNFAQYLEDLNTIPSQYDQAMQQQQQDVFNIDSELSLFTNTEFFDFDNLPDLNLPTFDSVDDGNMKKESKQNGGQNSDMDFLNLLGGEGMGNMPAYSTQEFNNYNQQQSSPVENAPFSAAPSTNNDSVNSKSSPSQSSTQASPPSTASAQAPAAAPPAPSAPGPKRKNTQKAPPISVEEASRIAAEEDKRRRNTAASARFRVKKKQREASLEKTVKETTDKNTALEARVTALELENQWLKNLITEKNGRSPAESKTSENDIAGMFKKFLASQKEIQGSSSESKIGVGTA